MNRSPQSKRAGPCATRETGSALNSKTSTAPNSSRSNSTAPPSRQALGLYRHLADAQDRVAAAPNYLAAREARRAVNHLRRRLRPAPVDGGAAVLEATRNTAIMNIVKWSERRVSR